jgi:protein-L-isoaspartate(D-aspartate) O-methyltransferase
VLSRLCAEVVTIERFESLAREARARLAELGYSNVEVRHGDGTRGAPDRAPFQGISVTATAAGDPPGALLEQLAKGGTLVCPIQRGSRELLVRVRDGVEEPLADVRFVPLISEEAGD